MNRNLVAFGKRYGIEKKRELQSYKGGYIPYEKLLKNLIEFF